MKTVIIIFVHINVLYGNHMYVILSLLQHISISIFKILFGFSSALAFLQLFGISSILGSIS